jgi:hypothetical protein
MNGTVRKTAPFNDPDERADIRASIERAERFIDTQEEEYRRREKNNVERKSIVAWVLAGCTVATAWPQIHDFLAHLLK